MEMSLSYVTVGCLKLKKNASSRALVRGEIIARGA